MRIVRLALVCVFTGILIFMSMPSSAEAACACSGIGVSNGYYAAPGSYGSYGYNYGQRYGVQSAPQAPPVQSKGVKAKKKSSKSKPIAQ